MFCGYKIKLEMKELEMKERVSDLRVRSLTKILDVDIILK